MRLTAHHLLGFLLLASACEQPGPTEPEATRTHALLRVERSTQANGVSEPSGNAFAAVVRVPELADPEPLLRLAGKTPTLPAAGQCLTTNHERDAVAKSELARAEFLDAGDVLVGPNDAQTLLAPRALPLEVPGKVYTSRDRDSAPLPSGAAYLLKTTGSDQLPSLELRVQAPEELREVSVNGEALAGLSSLSGAGDVPITWRAGDARDVVYIEVTGSAGAGSLGVCAFRDADGRGSLPRGLFGAAGAGSLSFHRLREVAADVPALDGAEVRFDFALTAPISYN